MVEIAQKNRKKRKISKKALIIAVVICLVAMIVVLFDSLNNLKENDENNNDKMAKLSSQTKDTEEDIYSKYNCEYISEENTDNNLQINVEFSKSLYDEDNNSNKKYFDKIVEDLAENYKSDFKLVDKEKNIEIDVKVNSEYNYNYTINSKEDYFKNTQEKNNQIQEYEEIKSITNKIIFKEFNKFDNNNWSINSAGVEIKSREDGAVNYENYKVLTDNIFINTIIATSEFNEEIIEGIKVGDSFDNIKQKLGEPTFKENEMIGYKTNDVYVFFYDNEVAIYPNIKFSNIKLENLIENYLNGEYSSERKNFAYEVLHTFNDFKSYIDDENTLNLESATRGIQIKINNKNNTTINIYNNYDMTEKTKQYIREDKFNINFETDLIYENESKRK